MDSEAGSKCTICCQKFDRSVNDQDGNISTIISQTICKIFGIKDNFEPLDLDCCTNCSSLIVNIHKILEKLDEAKLQLEEIIIRNTAAGTGDYNLDPAEIARNEIIKRILPSGNPLLNIPIKVEQEDEDQVLDQVLDEFLEDHYPECNLSEVDEDTGNFFNQESSKCHNSDSISNSDQDRDPVQNIRSKRGGQYLKYKRVEDFENVHLAKEFVKSENQWSEDSTKSTLQGKKIFYYCKNSRVCSAKLYLLVHPDESNGVSLFKTNLDHSCKHTQVGIENNFYKHAQNICSKSRNSINADPEKKFNLKEPLLLIDQLPAALYSKYKSRNPSLLEKETKLLRPITLQCQECGKKFSGKKYLIQHIKSHKNKKGSIKSKSSSNKEFKCPHKNCNKSYGSMKACSGHYSTMHVDNKSQLKCPKCFKISTNRYSLRLHLRTVHQLDWRKVLPDNHAGIQGRNFSCTSIGCKKQFFTNYTLQKHIQIRHPAKSKPAVKSDSEIFCCYHCGKLCQSALALKYHNKQVHEQDFQYFCNYCSKGFIFKGALNQHMLTHDQTKAIKPKTCNVCNQEFPDSDTLWTHKLMHKKLLALENDVNHKESPRQNSKFACEVCGHVLSTKFTLQSHMACVHGIGKSKYICEKCPNRPFSNLTSLRGHLKSHQRKEEGKDSVVIPKPVKCPEENCLGEFINQSRLKIHIAAVHLKAFKCKFCDKCFSALGPLKNHIKDFHKSDEELKFPCYHCPRKFFDESRLNAHIKRHDKRILDKLLVESSHFEPTKPFCCEICGNSLKSEDALKCHIKLHNEEFDHFCEYCGKGFVSSGRLKFHIASHEKKALNPPKLICTICNEEFSDADSLRSHKLEHKRLYITDNDPSHKEKEDQQDPSSTFLCGICGAVLKKKFSLEAHMACVHGIGQSKFTCQICNRAMSNGTSLRNHVKTHQKELGVKKSEQPKPFICTREDCSKAFRDERGLKIHIASIHENAFNCKFCDKNMSSLTALKNHIKDRHKSDEELIYPCSICGRRFFDEGRLNAHIKRHDETNKTSGQKFKCDVCSKEISNQHNLKIHMRSHTGEKPFSCQYCDRRFHIKQLMINHEACHSDEKNFLCTVCNKSFKLLRYLSRHKLNSPGCRLNE